MPTRHGTSRTALGWTCACTSRTTRADLAYQTRGRVHDERQVCCIPGHLCLPCSIGLAAGQRPPGSSHLDAPPFLKLKQMHEDLLQHYHCTDQPVAAQPAPPSGFRAGSSAAENAGANPQPQPAGSQDNGHGKLVLPKLNRLHEAFKRSQVSHPASYSSQDLFVGPAPFRRIAASRSSSPSTGPNSRPCVNTTLARVLRSSVSSTCLKSTRPRSRNQACAWR